MKKIMKYTASILIILIFLFTGCSKNKPEEEIIVYNGRTLESKILASMKGNIKANSLIAGLIDQTNKFASDYNKLVIDSLKINDKILFTVLLEYPNPVFNRFAIYRENFIPVLLDKSLNGFLNLEFRKIDQDNIISLTEDFISNEIFKLKRLSLYKVIGDSSAALLFRDFIEFDDGKIKYKQDIANLRNDRIVTKISSTRRSVLRNKSDVYLFDIKSNRYKSTKNIFKDFIQKKITDSRYKTTKLQITEPYLAAENSEVSPVSINIITGNNNSGSKDFTISVDNDWKVLNNLKITKFLKKKMTGTRYVNNIIGSEITIIKIPAEDSSEAYVSSVLKEIPSVNYRFRVSDKIESRKYFTQFFEISCGEKKYLIIFESSKYTYTKYEDLYNSIINSFNPNC